MIRACFADQVELVAELDFDDETEPLVLLVIDERSLAEPVAVEPDPELGLPFPCIRGPVPVGAVANVHPLYRDPGPRDHWTWPFAARWRHPVPERVPIRHEPDQRTDLIGRYRDGLFLAGFYGVPYLHLFDAQGVHQSSHIGAAELEEASGSGAGVDAQHAYAHAADPMARLAAVVNALPGREFGDIAVRPFRAERADGMRWGLFDETDSFGFPHAELMPDMLGFNPPWDGLYDT